MRTVEYTEVTIEDLRAMEEELWRLTFGRGTIDWRYYSTNGKLTADGTRRHRRIYRAAELTGYNFTPRTYDFGGFADAICNECGHRLLFNNQIGSWARKHYAKHLGVSHHSIWRSGSDLLRRDK